MRCFFSLSSTSVAAPTLITQTPPASLATRSWSFSRSQSESVRAISACSWCHPGLDLAAVASTVDDRGVVLGHHNPTSTTQDVETDLVEARPTSGATTLPPVRMAMSSSIALRRSPNAGAFTATEVNTCRGSC